MILLTNLSLLLCVVDIFKWRIQYSILTNTMVTYANLNQVKPYKALENIPNHMFYGFNSAK